MSDQRIPEGAPTRRGFVKTTAAAAAAGSVLFPSVIARAQGADTGKKLKVGLVGCGGRGTGAASQAVTADDNCELYAMADIYPDIIDQKHEVLAKNLKAKGDKMNVGDRKFVGLDAYQKVIDTCDVVLLCTPPGFRPAQFEAAVEAGKHVFVEKPCATDIAGVKRFMEAAQKAKQKNLSVLAGFCYRYSDHGRELFKRVHGGDIGEIKSVHCTYWTNMVKPMPPESDRPAGMSDVEWQLKNWYNYNWLGGDGIVEQGIHSVDKAFWAMNDAMPIACYGMGGRARPNNVSNTYDHFHITYTFPGGVRAHVDWSQYGTGPYKENRDYILGTDGEAVFEFSKAAITGKTPWSWRPPRDGARNMYQIEHDEFFANIRKGTRHADEDWMIRSTVFGIMGRMAAYTGKEITYEGVMSSGEKLVPDNIDWNGSLPVYPLAIPGEVPYPPVANA